jgi:thiocyanate hydrolase subunit beta
MRQGLRFRKDYPRVGKRQFGCEPIAAARLDPRLSLPGHGQAGIRRSRTEGKTNMTSRPELRRQYDLIEAFQPALHVPQNWNYENSGALYRAFMHPPHDVGGQHDVPVYYEEKEEEQWELNTYVTCEVLGWRGVWNSEERRRRADNDLGYTLYLGMPYYGRWIWAAARMMVDKKHISLNELIDKIAEVRSRHEKR